MSNENQKGLLLHIISHLLSSDRTQFQIFFPGPAECGKTFVIKLLMEICNCYTNNDGCCYAYITCASTGNAAVAISGTTVHTALKISLSRLLLLHSETAQQNITLFKYLKGMIIDNISMISAELLLKVDSRLKQITVNFQSNFGGLDIILTGVLRQLPPVRSTPIYKHPKHTIVGPILWRNLKFYELDKVMNQENQQFSAILTKIGNDEQLYDMQITLIESRFCIVEEAEARCLLAAVGLSATDLVIVNHGKVTRTTPELDPPSPNFRTTLTGGRLSLDTFNVHRFPLPGGRAFKAPVKKQDCIDQGEENSPRQSQKSSFWARLAVPKRLRFFPRIISLEETEMLGARTSGREGF
ncbi:ATP-dependent DNA helicase [Trichonephila clavipes]|nr:ATP-dependent DNA helicase [Trichonephila clavipes]